MNDNSTITMIISLVAAAATTIWVQLVDVMVCAFCPLLMLATYPCASGSIVYTEIENAILELGMLLYLSV